MVKYSEPSKELFEFYQNEDGSYVVTDIIAKNIDHFEIPEGVVELNKKFEFDFDESKGTFEPKTVSFPSTLRKITGSVFVGNRRIKTLKIPGNVKYIGDGTFQQSDFKVVEFEEGIEVIDFAAFSFCNNITEIIIPASCKMIGWRCFADCDALKNVLIRDPKGWTKMKFDFDKHTHKKMLFGGVPESVLLDPRTAADFLTKDVAICKK